MRRALLRAVVLAAVLAIVQGVTPLILCAIQVGGPAYLTGRGFCADRLEGYGYCGNYLAMFWSLGQATTYGIVLALEAGATAWLVELARRTFGESRRGFAVALLVPFVLAALVVPNFFYAAHVAEDRSFVKALEACREFDSLFSGLYGIVFLSLAYAASLELFVVSEWRRTGSVFAIVGSGTVVAIAGAVEGRYVAAAVAITNLGWLVARRIMRAAERRRASPSHGPGDVVSQLRSPTTFP